MKKLFYLAAVALMTTTAFTACSDDDNESDNQKFTDVFHITYDNEGEDTTETAAVQKAYDAVLTATGKYQGDSITIQGKDSAACADELLALMLKAEQTLKATNFSSNPLVFAMDKAGTRVYDARYGQDTNGTKSAIVVRKSYATEMYGDWPGYWDEEKDQYVGRIDFETPALKEVVYTMKSPNLNAESGYGGNQVTFAAAINAKATPKAEYAMDEDDYNLETVTMDPVTDVFLYDATAAEGHDAPTSIQYTNGSTYYRVGTNYTQTVNSVQNYMTQNWSYRGHSLYLYYTRDQSIRKRLKMSYVFTVYKKTYKTAAWGLFTYSTKYQEPTMDDLLTDSDAKAIASKGDYMGLEFVPMVTKKNGAYCITNDMANFNEGMGGSYLAMALTYIYM